MYNFINGWSRDTTIKHLINSYKGMSFDDKGMPAYRGEGGSKCLVGIFIPDNVYDIEMEGLSLVRLLNKFPNLKKYMPLCEEAMEGLQMLHDAGHESLILGEAIYFLEHEVDEC